MQKLERVVLAEQRARESDEHARRLERELTRSQEQLDHFQRSMSWRITAGLRVVYGWLLAARWRPR